MKTKSKKKVKEEVEEVFVQAVYREGIQFSQCEYLNEMRNVGVQERHLPRAAFEFAMDSIYHLTERLNDSEKKVLAKRLKTYFKDVICT